MSQQLDPQEWPSIRFEGELMPQSLIGISILIDRGFTEGTADWIWKLSCCREVWKECDADGCISSASEISDHLLEHRHEVRELIRDRLASHGIDGQATFKEWLSALDRIRFLALATNENCRWIAGEPTQRAEETRRRILVFLEGHPPPQS